MESLMVQVERPEQQEVTALVESRQQMRKSAGAMATRELLAAPREWYLRALPLVKFLHSTVTALGVPGGEHGLVTWESKVDERAFNSVAYPDGRLFIAVNDTLVLDGRIAGQEEFWPDEWLPALLEEFDRLQRVSESEAIQGEIAAHSAAVSKIRQRL